MSTVTKLDPNVRLDRHLRKQMRRDMAKDLKTVEGLVARGHRVLAAYDKANELTPDDGRRFRHANQLRELTVRRTVLALTLKHIAEICRDSTRTGYEKEAILQKLGAPNAD